jgi:hypothetical protein
MPDKTVSTELSKVLSGSLASSSTGSASQQAAIVINGGMAAGGGAAGGAGANAGQSALTDALTQNTSQLSQVQTAIQGQLDSLTANTDALNSSTAKSSGGSSTASNVAGGFLNSILGGGILGPILSGVMSLFGGGDSTGPSPLTQYAMPSSLNYQGGIQGSTVSNVDYDQNGQPRSSSPSTQSSSPAQITVNVSAMDSQSFLDRSSDIANAVRKAMLESSSLNDVIGGL